MFLSYSGIDWELINGCGDMTEDFLELGWLFRKMRKAY